MKVSELKKGMLVRPKKGMVFRQFTSAYATEWEKYSHLECHKRSSPYPSLGKSPVVYLGKAPKSDKPSTYEPRHHVYVTAIGRRLRVAPEAWRNMEAVSND